MTTVAQRADQGPTVGTLLRGWRGRRRITQLELALSIDTSARHVSFIETGRAKPSQAMVLRLAEGLDVPVRERNALLVAAGYAPVYPETPLAAPEMRALRSGLDSLLAAYEPNPALVINGTYDVLAANRGVRALLHGLPSFLLAPPLNAMRLILHPQGLASRIRNLDEWRAHLLERIERQIALRGSDELRELHGELVSYPALQRRGADADRVSGGHLRESHVFALPLQVEVDGQVLSFISTATTFNTPMDVTVSELAVEAFLPTDPETAKALQRLVDAAEFPVSGSTADVVDSARPRRA
ncbi:helix-turn-helix domain-containing protein [Micromonospora sp. NBRC 101691]|uniref:MmyB family transcriptional regulator n=1 Tax=Micromonospora sp. NBRC 101691 TaxID=3032198 RepID=UPI0024A20118|nr:helix-turn-helix domain-containing protein [Micromonospora sp. NBRC 101691]GLY23869.1 transcriptional regulator [Micromonospora sp. NBRC 101691]